MWRFALMAGSMKGALEARVACGVAGESARCNQSLHMCVLDVQ
jgi:hypothetical protein